MKKPYALLDKCIVMHVMNQNEYNYNCCKSLIDLLGRPHALVTQEMADSLIYNYKYSEAAQKLLLSLTIIKLPEDQIKSNIPKIQDFYTALANKVVKQEQAVKQQEQNVPEALYCSSQSHHRSRSGSLAEIFGRN